MNVVGWWASGLFQLLSLFAMYSNFSMISMCDFDNQEKSYVLKYNSSVYLSFFSLEGMTIPQTKKKNPKQNCAWIILVSTSSHRRLPALLSSPCPRSQSPVSNGWGLRAGTRFWREQAAAGASPGCPVVKTVLPRQGTLVQALVGKPRSRMPCGMAKKKPIFWFKVAVVKAREKVVLKNQ